MKNKIFFFLVFTLLSRFVFCQIYATPQSVNGIINSCTAVSAITTGGACPAPVTLTVLSSAGFSNGGKVLIIQMKSASVYQMDSAQFG